jgi:hypothetical protein
MTRAQERDISQRVCKFQLGVFSQWESYDEKLNRDDLYLYKSSKHSFSTILRVKQNTRVKHPLSFSFTKIILFNSYFSHKRNPKNMTSPLFWAMFGTFGQVVELEKGKIGLQRKMVFN